MSRNRKQDEWPLVIDLAGLRAASDRGRDGDCPLPPHRSVPAALPQTTDLLEYIEVFRNRSRRRSTLGYSSPVRFLEDWISKHVDQPAKAA